MRAITSGEAGVELAEEPEAKTTEEAWSFLGVRALNESQASEAVSLLHHTVSLVGSPLLEVLVPWARTRTLRRLARPGAWCCGSGNHGKASRLSCPGCPRRPTRGTSFQLKPRLRPWQSSRTRNHKAFTAFSVLLKGKNCPWSNSETRPLWRGQGS
jgi:hypothetical protein